MSVMFGSMKNWVVQGCVAVSVMLASAGLSQAADRPVVVELYTSQGCSSCPPADALLHELADRDDVIALALHVDYWDYIGWKDSFGARAHADRQRAYARAAGKRMIYTPQMIVGGRDHVVGTKPMELARQIERHHDIPAAVPVVLERRGNKLRVSAPGGMVSGDLMVQLVRYLPRATVDIRRGENAGRTLTYANIVTELSVIGTWNGKQPLSLETRLKDDGPVVVLIQSKRHGPILGAARLR